MIQRTRNRAVHVGHFENADRTSGCCSLRSGSRSVRSSGCLIGCSSSYEGGTEFLQGIAIVCFQHLQCDPADRNVIREKTSAIDVDVHTVTLYAAIEKYDGIQRGWLQENRQ